MTETELLTTINATLRTIQLEQSNLREDIRVLRRDLTGLKAEVCDLSTRIAEEEQARETLLSGIDDIESRLDALAPIDATIAIVKD